MKSLNIDKSTILTRRTCVCQSPSPRVFFLVVLSCFALLSTARGEDGDLGNGNTAEGAFALNDLTIGQNNTAMGASALFNNTSGSSNTAIGPDALLSNTAGDANTAIGDSALLNN